MMTDRPIVEIKAAIEEAIGWLDRAQDIANEDPEVRDHWKPLGELSDRIAEAWERAKTLLPLHPDLEAAWKEEWHRDDDYESPEAMGLGRR